MDLGEEARSRKAFRDRANQTADAEALRGMGDLECRYLRAGRNRAGRTELMPSENEACVESGSGQRDGEESAALSSLS